MDREDWDSLAANYEGDLLEIACEEGAGTLVEELESLAGPTKRVVDLGCGPGSLLPFLAELFGEVIAVDYAEELLEVARERCPSPRVSFRVHDLSSGEELPFRADVGCCINALIDPRRRKRAGMLRSVSQSIEVGGQVVIVVPAFESVFHVYHTLRRIRHREGKPDGLSAGGADRQLRGEVESFADGLVRVGGVLTKYWMREELIALLGDHQLRACKVRRVEYGWGEELEHAPEWIEGPRPWDWLVVATRE